MKSTIAKSAIYHTLNYSGLLHLAKRVHREHVLILTYHGVLSKGSESYVNRNCVSAGMFETQMRWLKKHYAVLPLSEIVKGLQGETELPPYTASITFDDGFRNNYTMAFPILVKHHLPATIFLTTDFIGEKNKKLWPERVDAIIQTSTTRRLSLQMNGSISSFDVSSRETKILTSDRIRLYLKSLNPVERERKIRSLEMQVEDERECVEEVNERYDFLSWDEIRLMSEAGVEFGSHTASHAILSTLSPEEVETELETSKQAIESRLGKPCTLFSYPNGSERDFTRRDQSLLQQLGYRTALSQISGFNVLGEDLYSLKRINIARSKNFAFFLAKITGVQPMIKRMLVA